jgi:hypothetical protein
MAISMKLVIITREVVSNHGTMRASFLPQNAGIRREVDCRKRLSGQWFSLRISGAEASYRIERRSEIRRPWLSKVSLSIRIVKYRSRVRFKQAGEVDDVRATPYSGGRSRDALGTIR